MNTTRNLTPLPHDPVDIQKAVKDFMIASVRQRYSYNFSWMGIPCIQYPQDMWAMLELIFKVRPEAIVEVGIAHGGSLLFYGSMLRLLEIGNAITIGVDNLIPPARRLMLTTNEYGPYIVEGDSTDPYVVRDVRKMISERDSVIICLDSHHSHAHVLKELELYSPLVSEGGYIVVFDTIIEHLPIDCVFDRPWGPGNSPHTAVQEFLAKNDRFVVDEEIDRKLLISAAPGGYLKCVK